MNLYDHKKLEVFSSYKVHFLRSTAVAYKGLYHTATAHTAHFTATYTDGLRSTT